MPSTSSPINIGSWGSWRRGTKPSNQSSGSYGSFDKVNSMFAGKLTASSPGEENAQILSALMVKRQQLDQEIENFRHQKDREFREFEEDLRARAADEHHAFRSRINRRGSGGSDLDDPTPKEMMLSYGSPGSYLQSESPVIVEHNSVASQMMQMHQTPPHEREREFQGVFIPGYMPLLEEKQAKNSEMIRQASQDSEGSPSSPAKSDRSSHTSLSSSDELPTCSTILSNNREDMAALKLPPRSSSHEDLASKQPSPLPAMRRVSSEVSAASKPTLVRKSSGMSGQKSPKRVMFRLQGDEIVAPSESFTEYARSSEERRSLNKSGGLFPLLNGGREWTSRESTADNPLQDSGTEASICEEPVATSIRPLTDMRLGPLMEEGMRSVKSFFGNSTGVHHAIRSSSARPTQVRTTSHDGSEAAGSWTDVQKSDVPDEFERGEEVQTSSSLGEESRVRVSSKGNIKTFKRADPTTLARIREERARQKSQGPTKSELPRKLDTETAVSDQHLSFGKLPTGLDGDVDEDGVFNFDEDEVKSPFTRQKHDVDDDPMSQSIAFPPRSIVSTPLRGRQKDGTGKSSRNPNQPDDRYRKVGIPINALSVPVMGNISQSVMGGMGR